MVKITVYTKPNCPLCDEAMEQIETERKRIPFQLEEKNILSDWETYDRFKHDIPVVMINDETIFRYRVDADELMRRVRQING